VRLELLTGAQSFRLLPLPVPIRQGTKYKRPHSLSALSQISPAAFSGTHSARHSVCFSFFLGILLLKLHCVYIDTSVG
jgi:hypothetical protein